MDHQISWSPERKKIAASVLVFMTAFVWFWFWRPYGLFGGDSEALEMGIYRGEWAWNREPLTVFLFQLSHQVFTRWLGWPVNNAISLVSCLAGATAVLALKHATRNCRKSWLTWVLLLFSGYTLTFYGAIEVYALPTAMMAIWLLSIQRVWEGQWPHWTIPLAVIGVCVTHLFGLFMLPSLLLGAYWLRARMTVRNRLTWLGFMMAVPVFFFLICFWNYRDGHGMGSMVEDAFSSIPNHENFLPLYSFKHLSIKGYFLWLGTGISLPFAVWKVWRDRRDPVTLQVATMAGMALLFLALFHPDLGYNDWDLFLFPSLPIAYLAAPMVAESSYRLVFSTAWIAVFLTIWIPRIPVWAHLHERGLGEVRILNFPGDARVRLDDRFPVEKNRLWVGGGMHSLSVWRHGERIRWKVFRIHPGDEIEIRLPEGRVPGPFSERIQKIQEEAGKE